MTRPTARFALNHSIAPELGLAEFFALARGVGVDAVELRTDIPGTPIPGGMPPARFAVWRPRPG
jgi:2-keto-myo-inositol isomerase